MFVVCKVVTVGGRVLVPDLVTKEVDKVLVCQFRYFSGLTVYVPAETSYPLDRFKS